MILLLGKGMYVTEVRTGSRLLIEQGFHSTQSKSNMGCSQLAAYLSLRKTIIFTALKRKQKEKQTNKNTHASWHSRNWPNEWQKPEVSTDCSILSAVLGLDSPLRTKLSGKPFRADQKQNEEFIRYFNSLFTPSFILQAFTWQQFPEKVALQLTCKACVKGSWIL